jgi:hypothetical protein
VIRETRHRKDVLDQMLQLAEIIADAGEHLLRLRG